MSTMSMEIMTYKGGCMGREETEEKVGGRIIHKHLVNIQLISLAKHWESFLCISSRPQVV